MKICVLSSGSRGNSIFFESQNTRLLVDVGLSTKTIEKLLTEIKIEPESIDSVLLTHNHQDHCKGVKVFTKRYDIPVYMSRGIYDIEKTKLYPQTKIIKFNIGNDFYINGIHIHPFYLDHDAPETAGFIIFSENKKVGIATDLGDFSTLLIEKFKTCDIIIIETNYDFHSLLRSKYPWSLKQRIKGKKGHLSNKRAGKLIENVLSGPNNLRHIFMVHISQENNSLEMARKAITEVTHRYSKVIRVFDTYQDKPSEVLVT